MSLAIDNGEFAKAKAEELIATIPLIPEIQSIKIELYTDHTGDPSFQVTFNLKKGVVVDDFFLDRFQEFKGVVQTRILHSDLDRFPYTSLEEAD